MATTKTQSFAGEVKVTSNLTVDTNTLHVDSVSGRVGVGKTDPGYTMDVNGTLNATTLYVGGSEFAGAAWTESGSDIYYTGGNVGIGTTNPQKNLEVAGPMRVANFVDFSVVGSSGIFEYESKLTAPDSYGQLGDDFGKSVSISGDGSYAIVGADVFSGGQGVAHIYVRSGTTWIHQGRLRNYLGMNLDYLGKSVSISSDGSYALAGLPGDDGPLGTPQPDYGSAWIYVRSGSTWTSQSTITAPDGDSNDKFGYSVSISGDGSYALVGAYRDDDNGSSSGSAYIFTRSGSTWSYQAKILAPDGLANDNFGWSVSISSDGSYALVGARTDDGPAGNPEIDFGSAHIFVRSGANWSHQAKITAAPSGSVTDKFGNSVAISGDGSYAIVGEYEDDTTADASGAAHIYARTGSTWSHQVKIKAPDPGADDRFGYSVSISSDGSYAVAGAYLDNVGNNQHGSAHIFVRSGANWSHKNEITAPDAGPGDRFGNSVSMSSDGAYIIAGAYQDRSAYIYNLPSNLSVSTPIEADGTLLSFTGQHICFPEGPMEQGLVVSANKNKYVSLNGPLKTDVLAIRSSEALPVVSLSNVANDGTVFGVVDHFEQSGTTRTQENGITITRQNKELGDNRVVVNSLGEGAIWVANTNGNVASGDFLTTSHLPGYAQKQDDRFRYNYTVAKSTMDCNFEPEQVPTRVVLKDEDGNNVLDSYGRIQWVDDSERTVPKYKIRYLDVSGTPTDEANAVHRAAFVGCTYHCG